MVFWSRIHFCICRKWWTQLFFSKAHSDLLKFLATDMIPLKCCWHTHFNITWIGSCTFWWGSSHNTDLRKVFRRRFLLALFNCSAWLTRQRFCNDFFSALYYKRLLVCCLFLIKQGRLEEFADIGWQKLSSNQMLRFETKIHIFLPFVQL